MHAFSSVKKSVALKNAGRCEFWVIDLAVGVTSCSRQTSEDEAGAHLS